MTENSVTRRDILRTLAIGAGGGSVLHVIPAKAAEYAHQTVRNEKAASAAGKYAPKFFSPHQYEMLTTLCYIIIPKDEKSDSAIEAGAPEFIDLLTSENEEWQLALGGGLQWLDSFCSDRYSTVFLDCTAAQRKEVLDLIAFRKNAKQDSSLSQGVAFFAFLRRLTCDGFYTSKIGIEDLQYIGNTALREFPGCPPLPEA
jgi:gluconate 2-dehydrogenase gamma chain